MADRIIDSFAYVYPYVGWALFLIGCGMFLATLFGFAAFGKGWLVYFATLAAELAAIGQGFQMIAEESNG